MSALAPPRLIHGPSSPLRTVLDSLPRIAHSRAPVLVTGESGTGKEGIVRLIHRLAPWGNGPFVAVNCGAIPSNLLESELFGHVRGAFTGADRNRVGRFEAASGGTLFLDEIGETPLDFQVKLLRVLQENVFVPVGTSTQRPADVRIVAATNIDVRDAVASGRLREDLFFRLDVIRIELPALRDRPMDIPLLARHFIAAHAGSNMSRIDDITAEALAELQQHRWPGNVRELENVIQSILVRKESGAVDIDDVRHKLGRHDSRGVRPPSHGPANKVHITTFPNIESRRLHHSDAFEPTDHALHESQLRPRPPQDLPGLERTHQPRTSDAPSVLPEGGLSLKDTLERLERDYIRQALLRAKGNRARAASLLGLNRTTLVEKLRRMPECGDTPDTCSSHGRRAAEAELPLEPRPRDRLAH